MWDMMAEPALTVWLYMTAVFVLALLRRDNSIVDIAWGMGFVIVALLSLDLPAGPGLRSWMVTVPVAIWGVRLSFHIYRRNSGRGEDFRYAGWRRNWGRWFLLRSYLQVFMLQGLFMLLIAYPVVLVNHRRGPDLTVLDVAGLLVWLVGFLFETIGDLQLRRFKRNPAHKGRIMTRGLWAWTRHPNYFGEALMWWGIALIALNVEGGWIALLSPLLITFLLTRVSGVPLLEKKYAGDPEFQAYARRTPAFFPWFPKKDVSP